MQLRLRDGKDIGIHLLENHPVEQEIDSLKNYADYILDNNEDNTSILYKKIDKIMDNE